MRVLLWHDIDPTIQIEYPYADLRTLAGPHDQAKLLAAQMELDSVYTLGIIRLRRIADQLGRLSNTAADATKRQELLVEQETAESQLRAHLAERDAGEATPVSGITFLLEGVAAQSRFYAEGFEELREIAHHISQLRPGALDQEKRQALIARMEAIENQLLSYLQERRRDQLCLAPLP